VRHWVSPFLGSAASGSSAAYSQEPTRQDNGSGQDGAVESAHGESHA